MANDDTIQPIEPIIEPILRPIDPIQSTQRNNLDTEIKLLHQEILDIKKTLNTISIQTITTTPTITATPTTKTIATPEQILPNEITLTTITLSDLLIKTILSRVENMLRFTAKFYTYIIEMGPCIIVFLFILRYILFDT
jgi:hypothetical protein